VKVRKCKKEDLEEISRIFTVYTGYSLYHIFTPRVYPHFLTDTTGKEHIFVAEDNNTIVGYTAAGVRKMGSSSVVCVYDIASTTQKGYQALMKRVEELGKEKRAAFIEVLTPVKSEWATHFLDMGFSEANELATMVYLFKIKRLITLFVENAVSKRKFKDISVLFVLKDEKIRVELPHGTVDTKGGADVEVVIHPHDLISLLLKKVHCISLVIRGKIKVNPFYRTVAVCQVINYLAEDVKMVTPFAELM
jgi:hypothetical protein